ncbi:tRNA pseudouridine(38-40) synthase TruA [Campylobacter sp. MIT 12-5580]|uniref:tRNA pseudouridine(38-40) synthase TruA n=1 Tax=Campylobacter sp. MIT 12-5580 TaxID=2040651 RepID=UPI0010F66071|nr:tRNA pseudouridine(38-40) synthase TruA [Campylobacter sp. MIT 12-5580]TKX28649.1 tRNA pseudouridine(38-40) synthase TruA [Campylobacter sp. MIT 12-5580]
MKLKLILAYDGSKFQGSATQPHKNSVQDHLSSALAHLGIFNQVLFASRTDKGVHALRNVASVECGEHFSDLEYLKKQINKFARQHLDIKAIYKVPQSFQPRFDAKKRAYRYVFNHACFSPFLSPYCTFYPKIDLKKANLALSLFLGKHNFGYFQKQSDKNTIKTMFQAKAYAFRHYTIFYFQADGFLRAQIRLSVAAVLRVLEGKITLKQLQDQIEAKSISSRVLAPANGLYLSSISY